MQYTDESEQFIVHYKLEVNHMYTAVNRTIQYMLYRGLHYMEVNCIVVSYGRGSMLPYSRLFLHYKTINLEIFAEIIFAPV